MEPTEDIDQRFVRWLERNEPWLRAVFRVVVLLFFLFAGGILRDIHRYRGEPDIRGLSQDVDRIQRDVSTIRERLDRR